MWNIKTAGHAGCMLCRCLYALFPGNSIPGFLGKPCMTVPGMTTAGHGTDGPAAVDGNGSAHAVCSFSVSVFIICPAGSRVHCHFGQNADLFFPHPVVQGPAGGLHSLDGEQLLHRDEPHPPGLQAVHDLQGRRDAGGVAVVEQENVPVSRPPQNNVCLLYTSDAADE